MKLLVKKIEGERQYEGKFGPGVSYKFLGEDQSGDVSLYETGSNIKDQVGQWIEGEVTETQYGKKFKLPFTGKKSNFPQASKSGTNESFALSYAKDIIVALIQQDKVPVPTLKQSWIDLADYALAWLNKEPSKGNVEPNKPIAAQTKILSPTEQAASDEINLDDIPF